MKSWVMIRTNELILDAFVGSMLGCIDPFQIEGAPRHL